MAGLSFFIYNRGTMDKMQTNMTAEDYKIQEAAKTIKEGGVIVCPTEGVYGLSADMFNETAVKRIIKIKQRALNKGLIVVASSVNMLDQVVNFNKLSESSIRLLHEKWPGHATFIVPAHANVPSILTGGRDTLAVRVTAFPLLSKLCSLAQCPIVSTSANISGQEPLKTIAQLRATFEQEVDYILDEPCQGLNKPSTIYDAMSGQILRP